MKTQFLLAATVWAVGVLWSGVRSWAAGMVGDSMAEPIVVAGSPWRMTVDNSRATSEGAREPARGSWPGLQVVPEHSLWFSWTAPKDGRAMWVASRLDRGTLPDPGIEAGVYLIVYRNFRAGGSEHFARSGRPLSRSAGVSFAVKAGTTYRILLDTVARSSGGFDLAVNYIDPAPPPNDEPTSAIDLRDSEGWAVFDLNGATKGAEDPDLGTYSFSVPPFDPQKPRNWEIGTAPRGGNSVWFTWTAERAGLFEVNVTQPTGFPQLVAYREKRPRQDLISFPELEEVLRNTNGVVEISSVRIDDWPNGEAYWQFQETDFQGTRDLQNSFRAEMGERFFFMVDQMVSTENAPYRPLTYPSGLVPTENTVGFLRVSERLANDDLTSASAVLPGTPVLAWGSATLEADEVRMIGGSGLGSWWWQWTSDRAETVAVTPPTARVFLGTSWASLREVFTKPSAADLSFATFESVPGEHYLIRVESPYPEPTEFEFLRGSTGDQIEDAVDLESREGGGQARLRTALLSRQDGEPWQGIPGVTGVGWIHWAPEVPGRFRITVDAEPVIFRGRSLKDREPVELTPTDRGYVVDTDPGEHFWFALPTGPTRLDGAISMQIEKPPATDAFDSATEVPVNVTFDLSELFGTAEQGEPAHAGRSARASQWYRWTCTHTGRYTMILSGPQGPRAAVYEGASLTTLRSLLALSPTSPAPIAGSWDAIAGVTYRLAFEPGSIAAPGLRWRILQNGPEEALETAPRIVAGNHRFELGISVREPLDDRIGTPSGFGSKWYRFKTEDGTRHSLLRVSLDSEAEWSVRGSPTIRVFQNSLFAELVLRGGSAPLQDPGHLITQIPAEPGTDYFIQVCFPEDCPFFARLGVLQVPITPAVAPPRLDALADRLRLTGLPGAVIRLENSRDLKQWRSWGDALCQNPFVDLALPNSGEVPVYYRAVAN